METKYGFSKMNIVEFETWLEDLHMGRTILKIQQHHTYLPSYTHFDGSNHFERQKAMKNHHVNANGWRDIGQHFTIFPDGTILTGRNLSESPACITGQNQNSVCIENFGNFDVGQDIMNQVQKSAIVKVTALLCSKFNIPVNTDFIVYHHWFDLGTGVRNNGTRNNKSCPGTAFFGGNKVADCTNNFLSLVHQELSSPIKTEVDNLLKYAITNTTSLNVRTGPGVSYSKVKESSSLQFGSIIRVYQEQNGWLKVSNSESRWVSAKYTAAVRRAVVTASSLRVRTGPGTKFSSIGNLAKGEVVFISETQNGWGRVGLGETWVSQTYLNF